MFSHPLPRMGLRLTSYRLMAVVLLTLTPACGDRPAPAGEGAAAERPAAIEVHDSAGVAIATVRATPGTPHWGVGSEPQLILGQVDGESPYLFQRPEFAARLSNGMVVVADFGSGELRWFDSEGRFVRSVGGKGQGPWEFREFNRVVRLPGDTLVIYDQRNRRVSRIGPEGERLEEVSLREVLTNRQASEWHPLGRTEVRIVGSGAEARMGRWRHLIFAGPMAEGEHAIGFRSFRLTGTRPPHLDVDTLRDRAAIVRVGTGGEMGVLAEPQGTLYIPMLGLDDVWFPRDVPFATEPLMAARGRGLVTSETGSYELRVHGLDGGLHRIIRRDDRTPRRVTRDLIDRLIQWRVSRPGSMQDWAERDWANTSFELAGEAFYLPAYAELHLDPADRIWVEGWRFPWDENEPRTFTIFEPEGRIVATATVPAELRITDIGLDHITGVVWDDLGVEYVHVYPIRR
jgi:hypothetical protein